MPMRGKRPRLAPVRRRQLGYWSNRSRTTSGCGAGGTACPPTCSMQAAGSAQPVPNNAWLCSASYA